MIYIILEQEKQIYHNILYSCFPEREGIIQFKDTLQLLILRSKPQNCHIKFGALD